jgi:hypothetical protein
MLNTQEAILGAEFQNLTFWQGDPYFTACQNRKHRLVTWQQTNLALDGFGNYHFGGTRPNRRVGGD